MIRWLILNRLSLAEKRTGFARHTSRNAGSSSVSRSPEVTGPKTWPIVRTSRTMCELTRFSRVCGDTPYPAGYRQSQGNSTVRSGYRSFMNRNASIVWQRLMSGFFFVGQEQPM